MWRYKHERKSTIEDNSQARRHADRNAGGGDHHRAVRGAGGAQAMFNRPTRRKSRGARRRSNAFMTALGTYKLDTGNFPDHRAGPAGAAREAGRTSSSGPARICRRTSRTIPGAIHYLYKFPGDHGDEPDIISLGADGQPGGEGNQCRHRQLETVGEGVGG